MDANSNFLHEKTRKALLWMNLSHEPFVVLYALLPFIIRKDLHASLLQLSILTALRPILPVFSFYWGANSSRLRLRSNLIGAWALARIPFLFVPWIENIWYLIFCCGVYELFNKSGIPALIEILKINLSKESREKTYSLYFVLSFLESILLGLFMANILDCSSSAWQMMCGVTALLGLSSIFVQLRIPIILDSIPSPPPQINLSTRIWKPWKDTFSLLRNHSNFFHFQCGFMVGGFSLMLITPSLALFCAETLKLSHADMVMGRSILMGVGIVLSSYFWNYALSRTIPIQLTQWILIGFAIYPLFLCLAQFNMSCFYFSFIFYGIAQAGSHLLWNLSGTLFAKDADSSVFSRANILMVGLRGLIAPALGGFLCNLIGSARMLLLGSALCFLGVLYTKIIMRLYEQRA